MRSVVLFTTLLSLLIVSFVPAKEAGISSITPSPLAEYSMEWNDTKYLKCNTAANATYMTAEERKVIYILNMARMNPPLFAKTVINKYPEKNKWFINRNSYYFTSLVDTMQKLKPINLLYPDQLCYKSAFCHASTTGKAGTVTHDRTTTCKQQEYFNGECCHYGYNTALDILLSLLIDENVPSLGHRYVCLGSYTKLGVSIQPHSAYKNTAVLDFKN
jgi:uncharacterized protein YkwD